MPKIRSVAADKDIGSRLKDVRQNLPYGGLLMSEVADILGISYSHYSKIESGINAFSMKIARNFCHSFGCNLEWLLHGKGARGELHLPKDVQAPAHVEHVVMESPVDYALVTDETLKVIAKYATDDRVKSAAEALAASLNISYENALYHVLRARIDSDADDENDQPGRQE